MGRRATPQAPRPSRCSTDPNGLKLTSESGHGAIRGSGLGADVDASGYLYTIATVGMTFAGLSVLTMILRQMLGGRMTKWDSWVTRTWVQLGFMTTFGSILPPLFLLFGPLAPIAWRISSGVMAVILGSWALTFPRRRHAVNPTRLPLEVVIYALAMDIAALALAENAIVVPGAIGGRLCRGSDRDTARCRDVVPVRVRALV